MMLVAKPFCLFFSLLLCTLVFGEDEERDATCAETGGTCVSVDSYTCPYQIEAPGCDDDEVCCTGDFFHHVLDGIKPPCKNVTDCVDMGGFCNETCQVVLGRPPLYGVCENNCACCIPPDPCPEVEACSHDKGFCRETCEDGEEPKTDVSCDPANGCTCCVKNSSPQCNPSECCLAANGRCDTNCNPLVETPIAGLCPDDGCTCCSDPNPCVQTSRCLAIHSTFPTMFDGRCNTECLSTQLSIPELCDGHDCTCCALPTVYSRECEHIGGKCYEYTTEICLGTPLRSCEIGYGCCIGTVYP